MSSLRPEGVDAEWVSLLESYDAPAVLLANDYRILAGNRRYREKFGAEVIENNHTCYQVSHHFSAPCDLSGESCPLQQARETGQPARVLHLHHSPEGEQYVDVELLPISGANGKPRYFLEILRHSQVASPSAAAGGLVGRAPSFNRSLELVERVATSEATVLLHGESGTGKELVAAAVHRSSHRRSGPFVPVDCSGLTETLFESELFGHERGAFTGAQSQKIGLVEVAQGGTLFLDELGDIPLSLQVKLLRLLETATYRRVGGIEAQRADFRLVCATHRDLRQMVEAGTFRADLYYRINTFPITLPALRERREDIALLAESLLQRLAGARPLSLSTEALARLMAYDFPGNIRELRNLLERATLLCDGDQILSQHLPKECRSKAGRPLPGGGPYPAEIVTLEEAERHYLLWVTERFEGERRELAKRLGLSPRTLFRKLGRLKGEGQ